MERMGRVLECALAYAQMGWQVLPLHSVNDGKCTCAQCDCSSPGKHPATRNGVKDATTDSDTIKKWFQSGRILNIGICAGRNSGLVVLDVDPSHGGDASVQRLNVPQTLEVTTGSGGRHFYFAYPRKGQVKNSVGRLGAGLDVRSDSGYVVAPPSVHVCGNEYRWKIDPRAIPLAPCPKWLEDGKQENKEEVTSDEPIAEGRRNSALASIAGAMRRRGCDTEAIHAALISINRRRCRPPLPFAELRKIAESISRYPPKADDGIILIDDHHDTIAEAFENWSDVKHRHHIET